MRDADAIEGTRVVTNNLDWGTVERREDDGWHRIRLDSGALDIMNAERLSTRHPFGDRDPMAAISYGVTPTAQAGITTPQAFGMWVITENGTPVVEHGFFGSAATAANRIPIVERAAARRARLTDHIGRGTR